MTFSTVVEVGVGLVLVYYVVSLIASTITSWIAKVVQLDAQKLEENLADLLRDPEMLESIMLHPWIRILRPKYLPLVGEPVEKKLKWIPPETFARVLADVLAPGEDGKGSIEDIRSVIENLPAGHLKSHLWGMVNKSVVKVEEFRANVEGWFNDAMRNASQLYAQYTKRVVLALSLGLTLALTIDTVVIVTTLWDAPITRAVAAATADEVLAAENVEPQLEDIPEMVESLEDLAGTGIPLFWDEENLPQTGKEVGYKIVGLLISWVAISQGSPFWYDVLKRMRGG